MRSLNLREVKELARDPPTCGPDEYRYSDARPMLLSQFYVIVYDVMILISVLIG